MAARRLDDLLAAAEAIGDDQRVPGGRPHRRQQDALPTLDRDIVVVFLEAEGSGHAAAARVQDGDVQAQPREHGLLVRQPHNGFVVAVAVHHGLTRQLRWLIARHLVDQKLAEQERLPAELPGILVVGEEVG